MCYSHSGIVSYIGKVQYAPGEFIGVTLDHAVGKNNGMIKGVKYFTCPPKRGLMVKPNDIQPLKLNDLKVK